MRPGCRRCRRRQRHRLTVCRGQAQRRLTIPRGIQDKDAILYGGGPLADRDLCHTRQLQANGLPQHIRRDRHPRGITRRNRIARRHQAQRDLRIIGNHLQDFSLALRRHVVITELAVPRVVHRSPVADTPQKVLEGAALRTRARRVCSREPHVDRNVLQLALDGGAVLDQVRDDGLLILREASVASLGLQVSDWVTVVIHESTLGVTAATHQRGLVRAEQPLGDGALHDGVVTDATQRREDTLVGLSPRVIKWDDLTGVVFRKALAIDSRQIALLTLVVLTARRIGVRLTLAQDRERRGRLLRGCRVSRRLKPRNNQQCGRSECAQTKQRTKAGTPAMSAVGMSSQHHFPPTVFPRSSHIAHTSSANSKV